MKRFIEELIEKNELLYAGNIAYANVQTENSLLRQMIEGYEYPAYSHKIISGSTKPVKQYENKYWQRVPALDIVEDEAIAVR